MRLRRRRAALDRLPPARRLWPTVAERREIRQSFLLTHPDVLELVLSFNDDGPAYAAQLAPDLARQLIPEIERCMRAVDPLLAADVHNPKGSR